MPTSVRSSRLPNHRSRRFISRHPVLLIALVLMAALLAIDVSSLNTSASKGTGPLGTHTITTRATDNGTSFTDASFTPNLLAPTTTTVNAGPDIDAANNDYRRIQNALNAAVSGDTIILSGTFDFTQPFAAAAWALGNDNTASTADDYEVLAPRGVNNVTLTATSLGSATIQGPGDLAAVNLEAFLVFDPSLAPGGTNQGWTISNLRILDFDLSIGSFAVGVSDFNNMTVTNNFIRIPTDLNATVAPADVNQNIGIHFSFGTNQTISNNSFQIAGDGVSDTGAGNFSTSVAMQSNTSGGNVYDGLTISNNVIHVLNAQSANPQVILGIWDEGHANTSNITISNNSFLNDAVGNSPSLNLERAFRVTSHSSATSTVTYSGNTVNGANIGYQWLAGANFTGNLAVRLIDDTITNCDTGVLVQSNGVAHLETDVIAGSGAGGGVHIVTGMLAGFGANPNGIDHSFVSGGSGDGVLFDATATTLPAIIIIDNDLSNNTGFGLKNLTANPVTALTNYWGSNLTANVAAKVNGPATFDPWLASGTDISASTGFQPFIYATTTTAANLTTLAGTAAADTGSMLNTSPVTLTMDGDTGFVPVAQLLNVSIQLGNSDDVFTLDQTGIPTTFDGGAGNDTLIGTNVAQTWNITGANSGNIPGATSSFINVESLRGGTAADSFVFGAAGSVGQTIDGNLGTDTLNNSAIPGHTITPTGPGTLDGFKGTATGVGVGFDNINNVPSPSSVSGTKTVSGTFAPNGAITYTVVLSNSSTFAQLDNPGNEFTDVLPAGLALVSANATSGTAAANTGTNTATWSGSIAGGGSVTVTITATINSNAGGTTISNQGTINYDADGNGTNESSRLTDDPAVGGASDATSFFVCANSIVVTANGNSGAGSLRQAILDACPGSTITFDMSQVVSPITLTTGELAINKNLTIQGPGANLLTVSGNNSSRVFNVTVASPGAVTISGLTIANGTNQFGGGIRNSGTGTINLTNSTVSNNSAVNGGGGGGIFNLSTGTINLTNSTVSGNSAAGGGGGIYINPNGTLIITDSTFNGNSAGVTGGGIENFGTVKVINCTISNNTAHDGSGIYNNGNGPVQIRNSLIALNTSQGTGPDLEGPMTSQGHNLIGKNDGSTGFTVGTNQANGDLVGTTASPLNPLLAPLANNGGPTQTMALLAGSPALDAGDNCVFDNSCTPALAAAITTDQRGAGFSRMVDGPDADTTATVDIGAFEAQVSVEDITDKTTNEDTQLQFTFNVGGAASITSVTATSGNIALVPNNVANIAVSGSGSTRTLTINPVANQFGASTITVTVNGTNSQSMTDTFVLTVNSVNDVPSFTKGLNQTVNEDAGIQTVPNWATNISAGPANESGQTLTFLVTGNTNTGLFSAGPAISSTGTLTYTPAANANGSATITIVLKDNGGTANGGQDTSAAQSFTITVNPVNDVPTANAQTVATNEDTALPVTLTGTDVETASGSLIFNVTVQPLHGTLSGAAPNVTYTPNLNYNGPDSFKFTVTDTGDGASPALTSAEATVSITVNAINDAPVNHVPGSQSAPLNGNLIFSAANSNLIFISDVDAGTDPLQVTLKATDGTLTLSGISGLSFITGDGTGDQTMSFTGSIADINAALNGMSNLAFGSGVIEITTNDLGHNGAGGPLTDTDTIQVTVIDNLAPILLTDGSGRAIALDSVTLLRDPFALLADHNFSSDHRTRITLFALNAQLKPGETASAVTAEADVSGTIIPLTVESVRTVPGFDWLTQVVVKFPDQFSTGGGGEVDAKISIHLRGASSNQAVVTIVPVPGNP